MIAKSVVTDGRLRTVLDVEHFDVLREAVDLARRDAVEQRCLSHTVVANNTIAMIPLELQVRWLQKLLSCQRCGHFSLCELR